MFQRSEERRVGKEWGYGRGVTQTDDGIRDLYVTGVQTCALPISENGLCKGSAARTLSHAALTLSNAYRSVAVSPLYSVELARLRVHAFIDCGLSPPQKGNCDVPEIGRAPCRERVGLWARRDSDR